MLSWVVCPLANLFHKALVGPEYRRENSDGILIDSSWALLSKIQTGKCWRSWLSSLSGLTISSLLHVMCMHNLSWAFAIFKAVILSLWDSVKCFFVSSCLEELVTHLCIFWIPCNNSVCSIKFIYPMVSGGISTCNWQFGGFKFQSWNCFCQVQSMSDGLWGAGLRDCHLDMEIRSIWFNAYYNYIHNPLLSCLLSEGIIN